MALHTDPVNFVSLYGTDGMGRLVNVRDNTTDLAGRQNAVNEAYSELAGLIKAYWRRRSFDYTSTSTPALTAGTRAYNTPTTSGAVFDSVGRLYFRRSGIMVDVPVVGDAEWLEKSATASTNVGDPQYARVVRTASAYQLELNRAISQAFLDAVGTLTLEYHIALAPLSATTDTTILPRELALQLIPYSAWIYAMGQSDWPLVDRLEKRALTAREVFLKHDVTRTGRPRQIRPTYSYNGQGRSRRRLGATDYGMES